MKKLMIIFLFFFSSAFAQQDLYLTLNTNKARPVAMGGAYSSIEDNIVSATYNPASLNLYQREKVFRVTFFFNPITPTVLFYDGLTKQKNANSETNNQRILKNAATIIKGIIFTAKFLDLGLIFNEQLIDRNDLFGQKVFFKDLDLWNNCYHTLVTRIKLADRVSIGASANLYMKKIADKTERYYGFNYGILVKPSANLNVGISYNYFPKSIPSVRQPLERLADQTINAGISLRPIKSATLSIDLRNLTEEKGKSTFEVHFGFEQRLFSIFALRGGFFQESQSNYKMISGGIGLIDSNLFFSKESRFSQPHFMLNYSLAYKKEVKEFYRWHLISLSIRL